MCFFRTVSIKFDLLETSSGHFTFDLKVIWGLPPYLYQLLNVMLSLSIVLCLSCIYCTLFHVDGRKETVTYQLEAKTLKLWQRYVIIDQYKVKVQATWAWDRDSSISQINNKKRSHTQLDSRKQVIAFQDRVITINIKEAQHPLKWEKQVIDKSSIMLKISTKSMHRVLVWEIGPANNTTRCSRLSKRRLLHAWHPSQLAINLSIDKSKWQIHVNNKSD